MHALIIAVDTVVKMTLNPEDLEGTWLSFQSDIALWNGVIGSCANFVKFSMSPNGLFGISTLNLISGGPLWYNEF